MHPRHLLAAVAVALIWGTNFVAIDIGLETFPPLLFTAIRFLVAAVPAGVFLRPPPGRGALPAAAVHRHPLPRRRRAGGAVHRPAAGPVALGARRRRLDRRPPVRAAVPGHPPGPAGRPGLARDPEPGGVHHGLRRA